MEDPVLILKDGKVFTYDDDHPNGEPIETSQKESLDAATPRVYSVRADIVQWQNSGFQTR